MAAFIVRRLIGMVIVLAVVSFLTFLIFIKIPGGDPALRMAGKNPTPQLIANIRKDFGFDKPFYVQYKDMMEHIFIKQDLKSNVDQTNVVSQIKAGLPATFSLSIGAGLLWLFSGIVVGTISAVRAGKLADRGLTVLALIGISMPVFWLGIEVRYYLAETNTWFPDGGYVPISQNPADWLYHMILPWLVLAVLFIGVYGRVLRSNILDTINEDYVRTAKAKGLDAGKVLRRHVLRNSLIPIVTLFGLDFAAVLGGGAILTESVFDLNGVGQYAARSIGSLDLPPIMGVTLYGAFFIVFFSALVDLLYAWLDPRIRPT
jgi:peptide/nickel transport system permease protein